MNDDECGYLRSHYEIQNWKEPRGSTFSTCSLEDQGGVIIPLAILSSVQGGPTVKGGGMCQDGSGLGSPGVQSSNQITDYCADLGPYVEGTQEELKQEQLQT